MSVKITSLQVENVKRVKALHLVPTAEGLTVIGGKNGQGKTSVLDSIAWALGGNRMAPSNPQRDGALNPPTIDITLSNGIKVKRAGKNGTLSVTDPAGSKAGQALLDAFVGTFALDLPKFMQGNAKDKANALLKLLGIGDELKRLDTDEKKFYDERTVVGRIKESKEKHAGELPEYPDAPAQPISITELIQAQQDILAKNGVNQKTRQQTQVLKDRLQYVGGEIWNLEERIEHLQAEVVKKRNEAQKIQDDLNIAKKTVAELQDESTIEIEQSIAELESTNAQVAANQAKAHAFDEAAEYKEQYDDLTVKIEAVRAERMALLDGANLPLPGLTVVDQELRYNGQPWDCMSGSEQLKVSVAIVRATQPECGFVLMDKLEQMDPDTMAEFNQWLEAEGLQVIATRVSTSPEECTIIIEDGLPLGETYIDQITKEETAPVVETTTVEEYF